MFGHEIRHGKGGHNKPKVAPTVSRGRSHTPETSFGADRISEQMRAFFASTKLQEPPARQSQPARDTSGLAQEEAEEVETAGKFRNLTPLIRLNKYFDESELDRLIRVADACLNNGAGIDYREFNLMNLAIECINARKEGRITWDAANDCEIFTPKQEPAKPEKTFGEKLDEGIRESRLGRNPNPPGRNRFSGTGRSPESGGRDSRAGSPGSSSHQDSGRGDFSASNRNSAPSRSDEQAHQFRHEEKIALANSLTSMAGRLNQLTERHAGGLLKRCRILPGNDGRPGLGYVFGVLCRCARAMLNDEPYQLLQHQWQQIKLLNAELEKLPESETVSHRHSNGGYRGGRRSDFFGSGHSDLDWSGLPRGGSRESSFGSHPREERGRDTILGEPTPRAGGIFEHSDTTWRDYGGRLDSKYSAHPSDDVPQGEGKPQESPKAAAYPEFTHSVRVAIVDFLNAAISARAITSETELNAAKGIADYLNDPKTDLRAVPDATFKRIWGMGGSIDKTKLPAQAIQSLRLASENQADAAKPPTTGEVMAEGLASALLQKETLTGEEVLAICKRALEVPDEVGQFAAQSHMRWEFAIHTASQLLEKAEEFYGVTGFQPPAFVQILIRAVAEYEK